FDKQSSATQVVRDTTDLKTGKVTSSRLWPWALRDRSRNPEKAPIVAALSPRGTRFAFRDLNDEARVDVWDAEGKRLVGFYPYGPKGRADWIGWTSEDRLVSMARGTLTWWEMPACKARLEVEGKYQAAPQMPPGAAWLAAVASDHVDILDAGTGAC